MKKRDLLYPIRIINQIKKLPELAHQIYKNTNDIEDNKKVLQPEVRRIGTKIDNIDNLLHAFDNKIADMKHVLSLQNDTGVSKSEGVNETVNKTISDNHALDQFYKLFEDKFRGSETAIKERLTEYKPLFDNLPNEVRKLPVIDLGCGRGEFLRLAKEIGLNAEGIDINYDMVKRAKRQGLNATRTDALRYLKRQKTSSIAAITGFHIVEHIPFSDLMQIFEECYRVIKPGGFALFETPNPMNLIVGASNFYMDPSHIRPIPPELLSFALGSVGFATEVIPSHPIKDKISHSDPEVEALMNLVYGPRDYAVYAKKL